MFLETFNSEVIAADKKLGAGERSFESRWLGDKMESFATGSTDGHTERMKSIKILLVEDNRSVRELFKVLLEGEGYEIHEAENGADGLKKAEEALPDLMILDLMMPDVDGESVLDRIRSRPELSDTPILVVSGKYEALDRLKDLIGDENVFAKPFEPTRLLDRIGALVGHPDDE